LSAEPAISFTVAKLSHFNAHKDAFLFSKNVPIFGENQKQNTIQTFFIDKHHLFTTICMVVFAITGLATPRRMNMLVRRFLSGIVVFALILGIPALLRAQDAVASITGIVSDPTGAVLSGVNVILQNSQTGDTYKTVTGAGGSYSINQVKPGPGYKIEFVHDGFKAVVVSGLYMNVNATRTQNAQLIPGGTRETVEVSAANQDVTLDTTDATIGNNVQVQYLNDLPVEDRSSPSSLFVQQPGTTLDGSVTGARVDQDRVSVDGLDVNDMATGQFGTIVATAPVDSVQEFRGVEAGYLSSANGGGGGQFELVTRSGTNSFHGSLVEYHRDTDLEANDWFNNNSNTPRPPLIRNQFGGNIGGPILKDKLFFFFDFNARRDTLSNIENRTVPLDSYRTGNLGYINNSGNVETLNSAQVAGFDPQGVGFDPALLSLFSSRYPHSNNTSVGDDINTGGFEFNAPFPYKEYDFVQRVDFTLNQKMKFFGRGTFTRVNGTESSIWFPGDPVTDPFIDRSYAWVGSFDWNISNNKVNQVYYGEVYENFNFPNTYNPQGVTQFGNGFGGTGSGGSILSGPYRNAINAQGRTYPIPVVRDDFSWDKGKHSFHMGGTFKWPKPGGYSILNYNSPLIGLGGYIPSLDPTFRPADICPASSNTCGFAPGLYDAAFALALAPYTSISSTYNYDAQANALPQGSGQNRTYKYYETELYFGDTWKVMPKLTVSYGLRWINYSVPYEIHGIQSGENFGFSQYFQDRVAQSAAGVSGNLAVPLIAYSLGGKANHAPGYFQPTYRDFGPRLAFAYSVSPKTVINAGAAILYDQTVINAVQYQQSQYDYLFQASVTTPLGDPNSATNTLLQDARFTGINNPPAAPPAPTVTTPFLPFVAGSGSSAVPFGLANGQAFNETIDNHLKTPYSIQLNFGFEHQIPGGFILRSSYVGRLGRRLLAQVDANQLIDFPDTVSGQEMSAAFGNLTQQVRAGSPVTEQPWFNNVLPQLGPNPGQNTAILAGSFLNTYITRGDFADFTELLSLLGILPPNVGMGAQFSENTFYTNQGFSAYHGLLNTLHKNAGHGLQFDLNYTWSHSLDNVSIIANQGAIGGYGFICDELRPRECRSNSDFDTTHYFNGNFIYDLPLGRGRAFGSSAPRWVDEVVGGWSVSGLPSWHSGNAYFAGANAFVAGYANNAPAILTGPMSDLRIHLTGGKGQSLFGYTNSTQANSDFTGPVGFNIGARNNLRGPGYFDLDLGLGKSFPITERVALKFRADAFNALNHPNFNNPCGDITNVNCIFGEVSSTVGTQINNGFASYRVLQLALRLEF
jgi:hypothetical protein